MFLQKYYKIDVILDIAPSYWTRIVMDYSYSWAPAGGRGYAPAFVANVCIPITVFYLALYTYMYPPR